MPGYGSRGRLRALFALQRPECAISENDGELWEIRAVSALTALNNAFRAAYADAKSRVLASADPTLIVNGDHFALLRDGRRVDANVGARSTAPSDGQSRTVTTSGTDSKGKTVKYTAVYDKQ